MSIRIKIILVCILIVFISASFLLFTGMGMFAGFLSRASDAIFEEVNFNESVDILVDLITDLKVIERTDEEQLLDSLFIADIDQKLRKFDTYLVINYENGWIVPLDLEANDLFFEQLLEEELSETRRHHFPARIVKINDESYYPFTHEFQVNQSPVTYYLMMNTSKLSDARGSIERVLLLLLISILFIVVLPLTYILSKDIIRPLKELDLGVNKIREGDLNFKLKSKSNNEIGKVVDSFEKMREELKKSLEKQIQYEESRKELISNISHDLKTPMTSIKGYVEGIMDGVAADEEKLNKYLKVIYSKSQYMDQMIDDLFMFSNLDLGQMTFNIDPTDIANYMDNCISELTLEYKEHGIQINYKNEAPPATKVLIDAQKIKRVITNIVQNAVKFMEKEEKIISIHIKEWDENIIISIQDNGVGIPKDSLPYIFDRFYRIDTSRSTKKGGSGLGLSIAKQIIEKHGGIISAESNPGIGTTITFTLKKF